jgi:hypothetical protein
MGVTSENVAAAFGVSRCAHARVCVCVCVCVFWGGRGAAEAATSSNTLRILSSHPQPRRLFLLVAAPRRALTVPTHARTHAPVRRSSPGAHLLRSAGRCRMSLLPRAIARPLRRQRRASSATRSCPCPPRCVKRGHASWRQRRRGAGLHAACLGEASSAVVTCTAEAGACSFMHHHYHDHHRHQTQAHTHTHTHTHTHNHRHCRHAGHRSQERRRAAGDGGG